MYRSSERTASPLTRVVRPVFVFNVWRRFSLTTALVGGTVMSLAACAGTSTVDAKPAEAQIQQNLQSRFQMPAQVSCPSNVDADAGTKFDCTATIDGQKVVVDAKVLDNHDFSIGFEQAVVYMPSTEQMLGNDLISVFGGPPNVTCDGPRLTVKKPPTTFTCTASGRGTTRQVKVTINDPSGSLSYNLGPPTNSPGAPQPTGPPPPPSPAPRPGPAPAPAPAPPRPGPVPAPSPAPAPAPAPAPPPAPAPAPAPAPPPPA